MFKNLRINKKLIIMFLLIGIVPLCVIAVTGVVVMTESSTNVAINQLESSREAKSNQLNNFFEERKYEAELLGKVVGTMKEDGQEKLMDVQALKLEALNNYLYELETFVTTEAKAPMVSSLVTDANSFIGPIEPGEDAYEEVDNEFVYADIDRQVLSSLYKETLSDNRLASLFEEFYIVDMDGEVLFTYMDNEELGMSLSSSYLAYSGIGEAWNNVVKSEGMYFADFSQYGVNDEFAAFIGAPIFDETGNISGVYIGRIGSEQINEIAHYKDDLDGSFESYITVDAGGIMEFRSDMSTMGDGKYVMGYQLVNTPDYVKLSFKGNDVNEIFKDSSDNMVAVSTNRITFLNIEWVMVSKMDLEEIIAPINESGSDYYSNYIQDHAYDDIFVIHPDGYVYYSAAEGFEYKMNLLEGDLANTNHSELLREVKSTKDFVFVDYEASEVSNYKPRAFMGVPIFDNNGVVEFVLSFEVSTDAINEIMLERTGLGEKGEAFLIGPDYRLRSDTYLDPVTKNVSNSFKNEAEGSIRTDATFNVLNGKTDTIIADDYRGEKSIISYTPVEIFGSQWGLVIKQDQYEAFAHIRNLIYIMIGLGLLAAIIIVVLARTIAKDISTPIVKMSKWASDIAEGSLENNEIKTRNDEIGDMKVSLEQVVDSFRNVNDICDDISIGKLDNSFELRSDHDQLGVSINNMRKNFLAVIEQANAIANNDFSVTVNQRSDEDELSIALNNMVAQLKEATEEATKQTWIKTGQSLLNEIIQEANDNRELSKKAIAFIAKYIKGDTGVMFVEHEDEYQLLGSYAFNVRQNENFSIASGEGVVGQAILERELIYLKDIPNQDFKVESASVNVESSHLIVIPCVFEDKVRSVIEIASYKPFDDMAIDFLKKVQESLAIAVHSNVTRAEMKELLDQTLKQSEELRVSQHELAEKNEELSMQTKALKESEMQLQQQQEELRQSNEELEAQTMELKASESKLQQQQEELRVTNEELEEKTLNLQKQKEEIGKKNEELERTQVIIEEKAKEVEISSKYKSEFLANMSHELRTPLNSILILSGFLVEDKSDNLTDKEREYATVINSAGKDLLELINDILDLSKIESGKMEVVIEDYDIRNSMEELYGLFSPMTNEKGIQLVNIVEDDVPKYISSDEMKVNQIVKNIVSNAIKFTHEGEIKIRTYMKTAQMMEIAISDTGIGIAEEKLLHIFGAFQQADGTTSRNYGGTGLGLSITKELAELLGGSIRVESEEGKGSSFHIEIPTVAGMEKGNAAIRVDFEKVITNSDSNEELTDDIGEMVSNEEIIDVISAEQLNINLPEGEHSVILIIEDDPGFSAVLEEVAKDRGHQVICVDSGEKGLAVANEVAIDAIILDLGLPGMNGWEALQRFKKWSKTQEIPIHIMSGKALDNQHKNLGFVDYLQKPVSLEKLESAFDKIESMVDSEVKRILFVTSDNESVTDLQTKLSDKVADFMLTCTHSGGETVDILMKKTFDCIIISDSLDDISFDDLVKKIRNNDLAQTPIILYTKDSVTKEKNEELDRYVESIIIKGDQSLSRLIDETTLFLNHVEETHVERIKGFMKTSEEKEASLEGKKVLVVDDDMRNTFALSSVLEDRGMEVVIAKNGRQGLDKLAENPDVDVVLMDIMMPVMDGYTAIRKIRSLNEVYSQVPIIALTAKAMKEDKDKCISAGANDYMSKPIKMDELQMLIKVWIY